MNPLCDDDLPAEPDCECPAPPSPPGLSMGREALLIVIGAMASAAAPELVKWFAKVGRRLTSSLQEPPDPPTEETAPKRRKKDAP